MKRTHTNVDYFLDVLQRDGEFSDYKRAMKRCRSKIKKDSHRKNSSELADMMTTHGILLSCLLQNDSRKLDFFQEARTVYSKATNGDHPRIRILHQCQTAYIKNTVETIFINFEIEEDSDQISADLNFDWLLDQNYFLKKMVVFGVASCEEHYSC
jgi:hypothetical protein